MPDERLLPISAGTPSNTPRPRDMVLCGPAFRDDGDGSDTCALMAAIAGDIVRRL